MHGRSNGLYARGRRAVLREHPSRRHQLRWMRHHVQAARSLQRGRVRVGVCVGSNRLRGRGRRTGILRQDRHRQRQLRRVRKDMRRPRDVRRERVRVRVHVRADGVLHRRRTARAGRRTGSVLLHVDVERQRELRRVLHAVSVHEATLRLEHVLPSGRGTRLIFQSGAIGPPLQSGPAHVLM